MKNVKIYRVTVGVLLVVVLAETAFFGYREVLYRPAPSIVNHHSGQSEKVVARIGGIQILQSELTNNLFTTYGSELLNQMLDHQAIQMEAEAIGLKLTRTDIDRELKRMQQGYESEEAFYKSMKEQVGMDKAELREDVNYKLLLEGIATKHIQISDDEITTYMKEHMDEFKDTLQLHIELIEAENLDDANNVLNLLQNGIEFSEVAKEYSIDTATASDGGDLGWVEEDDPFISAPVIKLAKTLVPGEISKPIESDGHYYIIRLVEVRENSKGTVVEMKDELRKQLALQKALPLKEVIQDLREKRGAMILDPLLK